MNTLASISPDQHRPLHPADQQAAPLNTTEQDAFNQITENFSTPVENTPIAPQLGEFAPVADPDMRGLSARLGTAVNRAKLGVSALGEKLRREKSANNANPERSTKMRKALVAGAVAVVATVYLGGKAYAGTKGIEASSMDDLMQPDMLGGGHAAGESIEAFSGNHAPSGAHTQSGLEGFTPWEAAPTDDTVGTPKPTPTPGTHFPISISPFETEQPANPNTQTPPVTPSTPVNPNNNINVQVPKDPSAVLGKTWEMPHYNGPEDALGTKMEGYLKNAFEANNIDPKTMTPAEKQAVIDAFIKENNITDTHNMHTGTYKSEATGNKITEVIKEHLTKEAEAKKTAAEKAAQAAAELAKTNVTPEEATKLGLDVTKLPKELNLNVNVKHGDGLYNILDRQEGAVKLTPEQQQEVVQLLNSDKVRTSLVKFAPESFYDYEYPADYSDKNLAGTHELRLKYNDGHLLTAEKQKLVDAMYKHIIEEMEKDQKKGTGSTATTTTPPATTPSTPNSTPATPTKPSTPSSTPVTPSSTPKPSTPPSSTTPSPSVSLPLPTRGA